MNDGIQCSSCGHYDSTHARGCYKRLRIGDMGIHGLKDNRTTVVDEPKKIELKSGYYIAELKHPSHKKKRLVVEVRNNVNGPWFMANDYFSHRRAADGLDNCYKLLYRIYLGDGADDAGVVQMLYNVTCKDLTGEQYGVRNS